LLDSLLQEPEAFLVFQIEIVGREAVAIVHDLAEVIHASPDVIHVGFGNP
jgi:hypothetical protein